MAAQVINGQMVEVTGLKELQRELRRLGDKEAPKRVRLTNKKAAEMIATDARPRTPELTGRLRQSVKSQATAREGRVKAGTPSRTPYAGPIHWGWQKRNIQPQPFIKEALRAEMPHVREVYASELAALIKELGLA